MRHHILDAAMNAAGLAKGRFQEGKKALSALLNRAAAAVGEYVGGFLRPPERAGDYLSLGGRLISKRLLLLGLTGLVGAAALFATAVYPWMEGRLWTARLVLGTEKAAGFTGRAELLTLGGARIYEGPLADGQITGLGAQYGQDGQLIYRGEFDGGRYEGEGRWYEAGVLRYAGGFSDNSFSGEGTQYDQQGRLIYQGGFAGGARAGTGVEFAPETGRRRYMGQFAADLREGRGTEFGPDGETVLYLGEFLQGVYSGAGRLYQDGALLYEGTFADGVFSGTGTLYDPATGMAVYEGVFRAGAFDGEGRLYDSRTGDLRYSGSFAAGLRSGPGEEYDSLGRVLFSGNYRDGAIDLMHYLGGAVEQFQADFGAESVRKTAGGLLLLFYTEQNLAVVCRDGGEGYVCWKIVSGLSPELAGVRRGAEPDQVRAALGEPFTSLDLELGAYYSEVFTSLGTGITAKAPVYGEKYLRSGYFIRIYYDMQDRAAAAELCATTGG